MAGEKRLLLREPVAHCGGEYGEHPLILRDTLPLRLTGDQRGHVAGDTEGFHGGFRFLGHERNDSTDAAETVIVSVPSSKRGGRATNTPPPSPGGGS